MSRCTWMIGKDPCQLPTLFPPYCAGHAKVSLGLIADVWTGKRFGYHKIIGAVQRETR